MLRVRTIYAAAAAASSAAAYLADAPGEQPGVWTGQQAAGLDELVRAVRAPCQHTAHRGAP